jgi:hypothetical protein
VHILRIAVSSSKNDKKVAVVALSLQVRYSPLVDWSVNLWQKA